MTVYLVYNAEFLYIKMSKRIIAYSIVHGYFEERYKMIPVVMPRNRIKKGQLIQFSSSKMFGVLIYDILGSITIETGFIKNSYFLEIRKHADNIRNRFYGKIRISSVSIVIFCNLLKKATNKIVADFYIIIDFYRIKKGLVKYNGFEGSRIFYLMIIKPEFNTDYRFFKGTDKENSWRIIGTECICILFQSIGNSSPIKSINIIISCFYIIEDSFRLIKLIQFVYEHEDIIAQFSVPSSFRAKLPIRLESGMREKSF